MILCCGEALIDMIPSETKDGRSGFVPHAGGAVFNTAIALGRLEIPVGFLSGISNDLFGSILRETLTDSHVDTSTILSSYKPTTLAFVDLKDGHATYVFYDENTAGRMLDPEELPQLSDQYSTLYFGGISLISEPAADFYAALAVRESANRLIMCDPNIRANFIRDEDAYRARLDKVISHTDILKVSDEDLNWLVPGSQSLEDKAQSLRDKGPSILILTKGSAGASAYFGDGQCVSATAQKVTVVDTVGAGDTFNAGVLAKLSELKSLSKSKQISGEDLKSALEFGGAVAAITVSRAGANPPWRHEMEIKPS